jgi:hypothetical protein
VPPEEMEPPADESAEDAELAALMGGAPPSAGGLRPSTRRSRRGGDSVSPLQSLPYTGRRL